MPQTSLDRNGSLEPKLRFPVLLLPINVRQAKSRLKNTTKIAQIRKTVSFSIYGRSCNEPEGDRLARHQGSRCFIQSSGTCRRHSYSASLPTCLYVGFNTWFTLVYTGVESKLFRLNSMGKKSPYLFAEILQKEDALDGHALNFCWRRLASMAAVSSFEFGANKLTETTTVLGHGSELTKRNQGLRSD